MDFVLETIAVSIATPRQQYVSGFPHSLQNLSHVENDRSWEIGGDARPHPGTQNHLRLSPSSNCWYPECKGGKLGAGEGPLSTQTVAEIGE